MLKYKTTIDTVTFDGSQSEGYMYPDTAYGDELDVSITHHHKEDLEKSITINIGDYQLLPSQLETLLEDVQKYISAVKAFNK